MIIDPYETPKTRDELDQKRTEVSRGIIESLGCGAAGCLFPFILLMVVSSIAGTGFSEMWSPYYVEGSVVLGVVGLIVGYRFLPRR
ncbi:MAG: hypothetical protein ACSHX6_03070 [Akkermansiaceae bacterium]